LTGDTDITKSDIFQLSQSSHCNKGKTTELTGMHALFSVGLCSKIPVYYEKCEIALQVVTSRWIYDVC